MKGYVQFHTESGSFAAPLPDDYKVVESLKAAKAAFVGWLDEVRQFSDAKVQVLFFSGKPTGLFPCDCYPDYILENGPRDGLRIYRP